MITEYTEVEYRKAQDEVEPDKIYSLIDMSREGVFWWITDIRSYKKILEADKKLGDVLQPDVTGKGRRKRYQIKGRNIIKFLEEYGPGIELYNEA